MTLPPMANLDGREGEAGQRGAAPAREQHRDVLARVGDARGLDAVPRVDHAQGHAAQLAPFLRLERERY